MGDETTTDIQRSEELFRIAAEIAGNIIYEWNIVTGEIRWHGDIGRIPGYSAGNFPRSLEQWKQLLHPDDHGRIIDAIERHLLNGDRFSEEYRIAAAGGSYRIWQDEARALRDGSGRPYRWIGVCTDVTNQRRTEQNLRLSDERFHAVVDQAGLGMVIADIAGPIVMANRRFCEITGYSQQELPSLDILRLTHPEDRPYVAELLRRAVDNMGNFTIEQRYVRRDGSYVWVYASVSVARGQNGRPDQIVLLLLDINHQKQVELALRENEQQLRMALETGRLGSWQYDVITGAFECSSTCMRNFGLPPERSVTYQELIGFIHPDDQERIAQGFSTALATHEEYEGEFRVVWPDGSIHWIVGNGRGLYDQEGSPIRLLGVTLDITARKMVEQERQALLESERASRAEAEQANRIKEEFLATLSHELRTPLNAILGWSQLLRSSLDAPLSPEELPHGLEIIERNARVQTQIIEDLLDMSRIISGKIRLKMRDVELPEVIEAALETMRPAARAKGIRIDRIVDSMAGPVLGDPARLQQVIWNLLSNAIKFTPGGGIVQIVLASAASSVEIRISDSGHGIKPEFLPHVFERFRQADATTTRTHGGLGLGLAIVKNLVEMHGGTVRALSDGEGTGATFIVRLPLAAGSDRGGMQQMPERQETGLAEFPPTSLRGLTVLVVDDEPDTRELVRRVLQEYEAEILTAASAHEALAALQAHRPDVLVSDIGMPDMDGYDLIRAIRQLPPEKGGDIPALALTAFARSEDRRQALLCGFQSHVAKPVEPTELVTVIASLAGRIGF